MAICLACEKSVEHGALRCRHCGVDLAKAGTRLGLAVSTEDICPPGSRAGQVLALIEEIEVRSPPLSEWLRGNPKTRGKRPTVDAEVLELLIRARRLYGMEDDI